MFFEILLAASIAVVAYTYAVYPALVAALGVLRPREWLKDDSHTPQLTLLVSAYNEQDVIEAKLQNCLALDYPRERLQILVASESTDGTNEIVARYAARGIELQAFHVRRGKSATIARVLPDARGDIIVFSDANAMYRWDALRKLVRNFADARVGAVIGHLQYRDPSSSAGGRGEAVYWRYDHWLRRHASRTLGIIPGITGSVFAIRKPLYFPLGEDRGDDYELCTGIAIRGHAVVFEPDAVVEERASETTPQQFRRKKRLVRWNTMSSLLLIRDALRFRRPFVAFQLLSHRLLRYTVPVWLLVVLSTSLALAPTSPGFALMAVLQVAFYALGAAGWAAESARISLLRVCVIPSYFVMVNTAAMFALVGSVTRGQVSLWQKQR